MLNTCPHLLTDHADLAPVLEDLPNISEMMVPHLVAQDVTVPAATARVDGEPSSTTWRGASEAPATDGATPMHGAMAHTVTNRDVQTAPTVGSRVFLGEAPVHGTTSAAIPASSAAEGDSPSPSLLEIEVEESTEMGELGGDLELTDDPASTASAPFQETTQALSTYGASEHSPAAERTKAGEGSTSASLDVADKATVRVTDSAIEITTTAITQISYKATENETTRLTTRAPSADTIGHSSTESIQNNEVLDDDAVPRSKLPALPRKPTSRSQTARVRPTTVPASRAATTVDSTTASPTPALETTTAPPDTEFLSALDSSSPLAFNPYRNWDSDSQERERELEERAREQNHPADDIEDSNVHEVNHYVPEDLQEEAEPEAGKRSVARWYLLLLSGNSTTVRLRQKDFAKYLKLNLAARLSVEYNDLRVNRVEFKPLLMVNVTIFSRPKDNEEVPLHMLADTNATLLELSGEEYHVVRFITIPSEHQEALASGFQSDSYTSSIGMPPHHVDMGVAVYFAIAAALVSILLAVFLVGLCRYLRRLLADVKWRPWRQYKPIVFPRWSLPLQHRMYADHIAHCNVTYNGQLGREQPLWQGRQRDDKQQSVWSTGEDVPVQKILAPEPPRRLMFTPEPSHLAASSPLDHVECRSIPPIVCSDPAPSTADTLLQTQPSLAGQLGGVTSGLARPNTKLSLFGSQAEQQLVVQPDRSPLPLPLGRPESRSKKRLQPQGRHPLDVRIGTLSGSTRPTLLGLDNPNYVQ